MNENEQSAEQWNWARDAQVLLARADLKGHEAPALVQIQRILAAIEKGEAIIVPAAPPEEPAEEPEAA